MKIAIVGAQGVGKTTLSERLSEILNLPLITEAARNYTIPDNFCEQLITVQKSILDDQIKLEQDCTDIYGRFISDRSVIDNMAYWLNNCWMNSSLSENTSYATKVLRNISNYDYIFYLPIEIELVGDGFRNTDKQYQKDIDEFIQLLLNEKTIDYYTLTGSLEERTNQALRIICNLS